jgi:hypothetical protein
MTTDSDRAAIAAVYRELDVLIDGRPFHDPELAVELANGDVLVRGNADGMLWLAASALRVALATTEGAHEHIDKASYASEGSIPMVFEKVG